MGFKVLLQNIHPFKKSLMSLKLLHHLDTKPHIVALTETWTSEKQLRRITSAERLFQIDNLWKKEYFVNVGHELENEEFCQEYQRQVKTVTSTLFLQNTNNFQVYKIINSLPNKIWRTATD